MYSSGVNQVSQECALKGADSAAPAVQEESRIKGEAISAVRLSAGTSSPDLTTELGSGSMGTPHSAEESQHPQLPGSSTSGPKTMSALARAKSLETCRVCGDGPARMHYGVPTCFGCKGFFRRTLKRTKEYTCRYSGNCVVDRYERNSCRYCRFKRCLEVGMDPKAVRPDRDAGRGQPTRNKRSRLHLGELSLLEEQSEENGAGGVAGTRDEWIRKLPVEMRTLLMQLMNNELLMASGDTSENPKNLYPLPFNSLRQILEDPTLLDGRRAEMCYEPYREIEPDELIPIAHRRLIAVIDMVDNLCALMDLHNIEDKIALMKTAYAPLALFCAVAATSRNAKCRDLLCLCCFGYISRGPHEELYHFANRLVDRTLDELVEPFRAFNFKEQETTLMKAIITLNPREWGVIAKDVAKEQVADLRDRLQETLYNVVRESHPKEVASSRFGNLLLFVPTVMILGNVMYENLQFIQSFGRQHVDPLLGELLDNIEPMEDLNGANLDDILSLSSGDGTGNFVRSHSMSSMSSFSSNHPSSSLSELPHQHPHGEKRSQQLVLDATGVGMAVDPPSDADYNITLTAETFSGMRHPNATTNTSTHHVQSMEVDFAGGQYKQQQEKPSFFLDPASSSTSEAQAHHFTAHTAVGSRHVFTVCGVESGQSRCSEHHLTPVGEECQNNACLLSTSSLVHPQSSSNNMLFQLNQLQHQQQRFSNNISSSTQTIPAQLAKSQSFHFFTLAEQQSQQLRQPTPLFSNSQPPPESHPPHYGMIGRGHEQMATPGNLPFQQSTSPVAYCNEYNDHQHC